MHVVLIILYYFTWPIWFPIMWLASWLWTLRITRNITYVILSVTIIGAGAFLWWDFDQTKFERDADNFTIKITATITDVTESNPGEYTITFDYTDLFAASQSGTKVYNSPNKKYNIGDKITLWYDAQSQLFYFYPGRRDVPIAEPFNWAILVVLGGVCGILYQIGFIAWYDFGVLNALHPRTRKRKAAHLAAAQQTPPPAV